MVIELNNFWGTLDPTLESGVSDLLGKFLC